MRKQYGLDMCLRVFPSASLVCVWKSLERRSRPSCQTRKIWAIITIILPAAKELCKSPPDQSLSLSLCAAERQRGEGNGTFPIGENIIKGGKKTKINQLIQGEEDLEGDAKERERQPLV